MLKPTKKFLETIKMRLLQGLLQEVWCSIIESQIETNTPYMLYDALSDHTVPLLNVEKFASGLDRFWVSLALTIRILTCELIKEMRVSVARRNCKNTVNKSGTAEVAQNQKCNKLNI